MPATTEATPSVFAIRRSAAGVTVVVSLSVLFAGTGSDVVADTAAVSVIDPSIVGRDHDRDGGGRPERHDAERAGDDAGRLGAAALAGRRGDERHRAGEGVRDHDARRVGRGRGSSR